MRRETRGAPPGPGAAGRWRPKKRRRGPPPGRRLGPGSPPPRRAATRGALSWATAAETRPAPKSRRAWQAVGLRRAVGLGEVVGVGAEVGGLLGCSVPFPRLVARRSC